MRRGAKEALNSLLYAIGAHKDLLKDEPSRLRELAHHHFVSDGVGSEVVEAFFEPVGFPPLQLRHPVVLLGREKSSLVASDGPVQRSRYSPCGRYLAIAIAGGVVLLVDRETGQQHRIEAHQGHVRDVCFSVDGELLFSGGKDGCVRAWHVADGSLGEALSGHDQQVNTLAVSPDGRFLASGSDDGSIRLWSLDGGSDRRLVGHPQWVTGLAWIDSERLVSASADSTLGIWTAGGHAMKPLYGHMHAVRAVAVCPEVGLIASGDASGTIRVWDAEHQETVDVLSGHGDSVTDLAFDPQGHFLLSASGDRSVVVWDTVSRAILGRFPAHPRKVLSVAWSPEGQPASLAADRIHREWTMAAIRPNSRKMAHQAGVRACALTNDGRVISASRDYTLSVWAGQDMIRYGALEGHQGSVESIEVLPSGDRALSVSNDGMLIVWDLSTYEVLFRIDCEQGPLVSCAVAHGGRLFLTGGRDGSFKIWDSDTQEKWFDVQGHGASVRCCVVHPDGRRVITGSYDSVVRVWEARTGRLLGSLELHQGSIIDCALSAGGNELVVASMDGTLSFWELETGGLIAQVRGHEGGAIAVCSLGDQHVVSAGMDGFLRVWDSECAVCIHEHPVATRPAALASNGNGLICGDKQGNLWVFDWKAEELRASDWPKGNPRLIQSEDSSQAS